MECVPSPAAEADLQEEAPLLRDLLLGDVGDGQLLGSFQAVQGPFKDFSSLDTSRPNLHGQDDAPLTPYEKKLQKDIDRLTGVWGGCESIQRFLRKINKTTTKMAYLPTFNRCMTWLKEAPRDCLDSDELITDDLRAVYESEQGH